MKKHISEIELCDDTKPNHRFGSSCENYHKDDFCLLCGYFMEGDRLYMEIHGSNGALNRVKDIDSAQPYVCMECAEQFYIVKGECFHPEIVCLSTFFKEDKYD